MLIGSSALPVACTEMFHNRLQHFLFIEEVTILQYHKTSFFKSLRLYFYKNVEPPFLTEIVSYDNGKVFSSRILRYMTVETFHCTFIIVGSNISHVPRNFRSYRINSYTQSYYAANLGKYFAREASRNMSAACIQSTHSMI